MKLTAILLLSASMLASAAGNTQGITLKAKDQPLEQVLSQLKKQSGYNFVYTGQVLQQAGNVTVNLKNTTLEQALDACLKNKPLTYTIIDKIVVIKLKQESPNDIDGHSGLDPESFPPPIDVRGKIVNEKGEPVAASIVVKGTNKGTTTNDNGEFELKGVDDNATLIISGVSIETFEVKVNGRSELALNAKIKTTQGEEVIVEANTGYQKVKPNEVTGSLVVITKDKLEKRVATDIISKLEGMTNALVFNKDANTGENQLRIRGESTIFGYTNPLIVVDNFPYPYDKINDINPNDVESVTVLKDAAAASIWGAQAGNGVIVITTKHSKANQPLKMEFNANTTIANKPNLSYTPYISSGSFIDFEIFLFKNGRYFSELDPNNLEMPPVSPVVEILNNRALGLISSSDSASQINVLRNYDWRNDYLKYLYRRAVTQQYQLNLSAGGNKSGYYFSAGYDKSLMSVIGNDYSRITIANRNFFNPFPKLEIHTEINYQQSLNHNNGYTSENNVYPYSRLKDENGVELPVRYHRSAWEDTISNHGFVDWHYFPLRERELNDNKSQNFTTRLNTSARYRLLRYLFVEAAYQYYRSIERTGSFFSPESYFIRNQINRFAILDNNGNFLGTNYPKGGQLDLANNETVGQNARFKVDYNASWGNNSLTALAGIDISEVRSDGNTSRFYGYDQNTGAFVSPDPITYYSTFPSGSAPTADFNLGLSDFGKLNRLRSFYGNASYTFKQRYSISTSARLDQANIFGVKTNHKGTPLWSIGGRWNLSKESFYKIHQFPALSIHVTYGYQGNFSPDAVALVTLKFSNPASFTGLPTSFINNYPNPQLRWEKVGQLNIGLDFSNSNNRISGTIEYFKKNGKDLIGSSPIDPTTGITSLTGNFSDMKSKGIDISLDAKIKNAGSFRWSTTLIFNYASEKITRYDNPYVPTQLLNSYAQKFPVVGYPINPVFSYKWGGLDANGDPAIILADTLNKDYSNASFNSIKFADLVYNGRYYPPFNGSLFNTLSWRHLSLGFNISYKLGHYFRRSSINYSSLIYDWRSGNSDYEQRWQKPGDEKNTDVPAFIYPVPSSLRDQYYLNSDVLVEKADHIRLQFVNLSYQFESSLIKRIKMQNLTAFFYANNLGIIWRANKHNIDPDYPYLSYPPSRSYSFGVKAGF